MKKIILYSILNEWRDEDMDDSPIDLDDDMNIEPTSSDINDEPDLDDDEFALSTTQEIKEPFIQIVEHDYYHIKGLIDKHYYDHSKGCNCQIVASLYFDIKGRNKEVMTIKDFVINRYFFDSDFGHPKGKDNNIPYNTKVINYIKNFLKEIHEETFLVKVLM